MAYADLTYPKTWRVLSCQGMDLQTNDYLLLYGDGNGDIASRIDRKRGNVQTAWGKECLYLDGTDKAVMGTHTNGLPFSIKFAASSTHTGVIGNSECVQELGGRGSGPNPGGSWTAEQGG